MKQVRFFVLMVLVLITTHSMAQQSTKMLIAAASDLKFALDSIVTAFKKKNPGIVDVTYGSSGKLFEQLANSAPFDIFFSADINYPNQLKEKGLTHSEIYLYWCGENCALE